MMAMDPLQIQLNKWYKTNVAINSTYQNTNELNEISMSAREVA